MVRSGIVRLIHRPGHNQSYIIATLSQHRCHLIATQPSQVHIAYHKDVVTAL